MKKYSLLLLVLFAFVSFNVQAQSGKITSKKTLGTYQFFDNGRPLKNKDLAAKLKGNMEAAAFMQKARTNSTWATILSGAGGALIGYPIGTALGGGEPQWGLVAVGAGLVGVSIPFNTGFNKNSQRAVELYNAGPEAPTSSTELRLGVSGNGLGLVLQF